MPRRLYLVAALASSTAIGLALALTILSTAESPAAGPPGRPLHDGPLAEALSVFRTRPAANFPADVRAEAEHAFGAPNSAVPKNFLPGELEINEARRLLSELGTTKATLYAWPTSKGAVCYLVTKMFGGCDKQLTSEYPVSVVGGDPDARGSGAPGAIAGLVTDDVVKVSIRIGETAHPARLANNAYFIQLPVGIPKADAIIAHYANGATRTLLLPQQRQN